MIPFSHGREKFGLENVRNDLSRNREKKRRSFRPPRVKIRRKGRFRNPTAGQFASRWTKVARESKRLHGFVARFYYYFLGYDISTASGIPRARHQFAMVSRQCPFYEPARMCCCYYICGTRLSVPVTIFRSFSKAKRYRIVHKEKSSPRNLD